jgi:hypothetical protein
VDHSRSRSRRDPIKMQGVLAPDSQQPYRVGPPPRFPPTVLTDARRPIQVSLLAHLQAELKLLADV